MIIDFSTGTPPPEKKLGETKIIPIPLPAKKNKGKRSAPAPSFSAKVQQVAHLLKEEVADSSKIKRSRSIKVSKKDEPSMSAQVNRIARLLRTWGSSLKQ